MNFNNDIFKLKEAVGKDTKIFIEVYEDLKEKYPDKKDTIIDVIEKELKERSKIHDAFFEYADRVMQQREVAQAI
jgi:hypothetical protein